MSRYLTPDAKEEVVAAWLAKRDGPFPDMPENAGGYGYPDPAMFPLTDAINAIPGVCTLQSCEGHRTADGYVYPGNIWLWLDERMAARFYQAAPVIASKPGIDDVSLLWRDREIVSITFAPLSALDPLVRWFSEP